MDVIKKHYEKVLLAAALIALIGSAAFLAFRASALSEEVSAEQLRLRPKVKTVKPGDFGSYTNAIASLESPVLWRPHASKMFEEKARPVGLETNRVAVAAQDPIGVAQIIRQPFKLIFKSYTGQGRNFAVNFLTGGQTFFVDKVGDEVKDRFRTTGYLTTKFDYKTLPVYNATLGVTNEVDVSELTIQHPGDDPIVMPLNKVIEEKEPVAVVQCADGSQQFQIRRAQDFECGSANYNVVDITSTQVIIVNKLTKQTHTIRPAGGR